jgi:hypothetical protein
MVTGITKLLETILVGRRNQDSLDELQLEAAQERLQQRKTDLDESVDELGKMIRRMKRGKTKEVRGK